MTVLKNARHERFAQELASGKSIDAAYVAAGYSQNRGNSARLNADERVRARVTEIQIEGAEKASVTVARVLQELGHIGFSDLKRALDQDGNLLPPEMWPPDFAASVSSIEVVSRPSDASEDEEETEESLEPQGHGGSLQRKRKPVKVEFVHKIKFWDKNSALEKLAKYLGMFVDRDPALPPNPAKTVHSGTVHHVHELSAESIAKLEAIVK